jgi:enamine deaminase RidA (YjgF/YER057c/UK114 family)
MDAVLQDAGATLGDIEQATSFIKDPADLPTYERTMEGAGLAELPALATVADVCRDELLFEIDATAVVPLDGSE